MSRRTSCILRHVLVWLALSTGFFFLVEPAVLAYSGGPSWSNLGIWLIAEGVGLVVIFVVMLIALVINLKKIRARVQATDRNSRENDAMNGLGE